MNTRPRDEETGDMNIRRAGVMSSRVCALMLVLYALYYARALFVPVVTALVVYLTLRPLVRQAHRSGVPPAVGAVGIIALVLLSLGLGTYLVLQPAQTTIAEAPRYMVQVKKKLSFITKKLKQAGELLEIPVLDHLIYGEEEYFSFADEGIL